jgi:hypothetical protein
MRTQVIAMQRFREYLGEYSRLSIETICIQKFTRNNMCYRKQAYKKASNDAGY